MVVLKINADTPQEREVKIVSDKGTWESGTYHVFPATSLDDIQTADPKATDSSKVLAELSINKENMSWIYDHSQLSADEEKEIAEFVMDYTAPDGVY